MAILKACRQRVGDTRSAACARVFFTGGTLVAEAFWPGRIALGLAGLATLSVAVFPLRQRRPRAAISS